MKRIRFFLIAIITVMLLSGCTMRTVDQLYRVPKRSAAYENLQSVIDAAMESREYSAPLTGENRQTVQSADLDGDGRDEYLVFTKGASPRPMQILILWQQGDKFVLGEVLEGSGAEFDRVEYADMDGQPGMELIVGRQVSEQVLRSVCVYTFRDGLSQQLLSGNYLEMITAELSGSGSTDLLLLGAGESESHNGAAFLYGVGRNGMEFYGQCSLSGKVEDVTRIMPGILQDGNRAVYVASAAGEDAIITDVFSVIDSRLQNISFSTESGTSVQTLRNFYVYAADIDGDGVLELPSLIKMEPLRDRSSEEKQYLIRWYSLYSDGSEQTKEYTYHNFMHGWFLTLDESWAHRLSVIQNQSWYDFYIWDERFNSADVVFSIASFTGTDREVLAAEENRFILYRGETATYSAKLEVPSVVYQITQEDLTDSFHLVYQEWNTGET